MESAKLIKDNDVKTLLILKMFSMGLMSEEQAMSSIEFPRPKARNRQIKKYLKKMIGELKKYEDLFPGHLAEMIEETEKGLRESSLSQQIST